MRIAWDIICWVIMASPLHIIMEMLKLFRPELHKVKRYFILYLKALANASLLSIHLGKLEEVDHYIKELKQHDENGNEHKQYRIILLELMRHNQGKQFSESVGLIERNKHLLGFFQDNARHEQFTQEKVYLIFHMITAYFGAQNYKQAAKLAREFIQMQKDTVKKDAYRMARIVNLIIHFELDNADLLVSELRSAHRMLKNEKKLFRFESIFLKFISRMDAPLSAKEKKNLVNCICL